MQNHLLEQTAVAIILEHHGSYDRHFKNLDSVISSYRNIDQNEILTVLVSIRKSLNELVVANMQLRSYNNLFNGNSDVINSICEYQNWIANAAVVLTMDLEV